MVCSSPSGIKETGNARKLFKFERGMVLRWPKGKTKVTESRLSPSRIPA
jgi:hypothetical protein